MTISTVSQGVSQPPKMTDSDDRQSKAQKFDGTDWWTWRFHFEERAVAKSLQGYVDDSATARLTVLVDAQEKRDGRQRWAFALLMGTLLPDNLIMLVRVCGTSRQPPSYAVVQCRPHEA